MLQEKKSSPWSRSDILKATQQDYHRIATFLNQNTQTYRHLDWISPLDWIGNQPYLISVAEGSIQAALCTAPENSDAAWVRLFACRKKRAIETHWHRLLPIGLDKLQQMGVKRLAALGLHPWFESLLVDAGFSTHQNVVVLEWGGNFPEKTDCNEDILIRPMKFSDLIQVEQLDRTSFPPLWQNALPSLTRALKQTGISTVAILNEEIVGYQISTIMTIYGHLARLAVNPSLQRQGIAYTLVYDLLNQFNNQGMWRVTVNTQSDNHPSLALYEKFGFHLTNEEIKVYEKKI